MCLDQSEVDWVKDAFRANPKDVGIGLVNPTTGEIRLGSFDGTNGQAHQGLAHALNIFNNADWRGFIVTADGQFVPGSHFNLPDGGLVLRPDLSSLVEQELRRVGLVW
jgi:hypothetical protein